MEVIKFIVKSLEVHNKGQGVFSTDCPKMWEMSDEEFKKRFLNKDTEVAKDVVVETQDDSNPTTNQETDRYGKVLTEKEKQIKEEINK